MRLTHPAIRSIAVLAIVLWATHTARGQITSLTNTTSTPVPGVGHDYIHMLNETVNPANGAVSLRIAVPVPAGRKISLPFSFAYDSNGVHHFIPLANNFTWLSNKGFLSQGGWTYTLPMMSADIGQQVFSPDGGQTNYTCDFTTDYMFQDPSGQRHQFQLSNILDSMQQCSQFPSQPEQRLLGGDDFFGAALTASPNGIYPLALTLADADGTVYSFSTQNQNEGGGNPNTTTFYGLPGQIEDRNGNKLIVNDNRNGAFTVTDSAGRSVISSSGFGATGNSITVSGLANPYSLSWGTTSTNFTPTATVVQSDEPCSGPPADTETEPIVTAITLPNGKQYQFLYDGTYGLLNKVVYPTGGYVSYTWGLNSFSDGSNFLLSDSHGTFGCDLIYGMPAVTSRVVSFDGVTIALQQDFSYSTTYPPGSTAWSSKQTTVTTHDVVRGTNWQTVYNYTPVGALQQPNTSNIDSTEIPVEGTVTYKDTNGSTLRTVTKGWLDIYLLGCEATALDDGKISATWYAYGPGGQLTDKKEYDYGLLASPGMCQSNGSTQPPPSGFKPTRETVINYQSFSNSPLYSFGPSIFDRPCDVNVFISTQTATLRETQIFYDGGSTLCSSSGGAATAAVNGLVAGTHDETNYGPNSTVPRGNSTKIDNICQPCGHLVTLTSFDETGQPTSVTDPKGNVTQYSFADNFSDGTPPGNTDAYMTRITRPTTNGVAHIESFKYAYSDGQLTSSIDENNQPTNYFYSDSLRRLTETDYPDGGKTTLSYNDNAPAPTVTASKLISTGASGVSMTTVAVMDGIGHTTQTQLTTDPDGATYTASAYDGLGRPRFVYNPTRCSPPTTNCSEPTWGFTTYAYDAIGRTTQVTRQDGQTVSTAYNGNCTTVTDEASKARKSCTDGLDRLTQVFEDPAALNYETDYTYNGLDDLTNVTQKGGSTINWRRRSFLYDSRSRLISSTNPESNTVTSTGATLATTYTYDANSNLISKISPAQNQTGTATATMTYCYDALNRLTAKAYTQQTCTNGTLPSPVATYTYDQSACLGAAPCFNLGRRTGMSDQAGSEAWAYDQMGRVIVDQRTNNGTTLAVAYTYNLDGSLLSFTYPNKDGSPPETHTFPAGGAGRPLSDHTTVQGADFSSFNGYNAHYAPNGSICHLNSDWGNSFNHYWTYNNRFQPVQIQLWGTNWGSSPSPCVASTDPAGDDVNLTYSFVDANGHNNGNVASIANRDSTRTQSFTYDSVNRVSAAQTSSTFSSSPAHCWAEQYSYDGWGNLLSIAPGSDPSYTGCSQESGFNFTGSIGVSNRIVATGYTYDSAGNLTAAPPTGTTYTYDAENHLTSTGGISYTYDGDGKRIWKAPSSAPTQPTTIYWYDTDGKPIIETDGAGNTVHKHYYFYGMHLGRSQYSPGYWIDHYGLDGLGNTRFVYGIQGASDISDYYPFGGERAYSSSAGNNFKFTSKERDSESGLDNFEARYFTSSFGRFMSPDPMLISARRTVNPQIWNAYSYAGNNPLRYVDATGQELVHLGQHTEDQIKNRTREINQQLKDKNLSQADKAKLKAEMKTLSLEKEGNRVVGNLLAALDKTSERNGLTLQNFTLSTDTRNDFSGKLTAKEIDRISKDQAFVIQNDRQLSGTIYVRSEPQLGFYQLSQSNSDFTYFGASALSHEQVHLGGYSENLAYQRQLFVFEGFKNFFQSQVLYGDLDAAIKKGLEDNKNH